MWLGPLRGYLQRGLRRSSQQKGSQKVKSWIKELMKVYLLIVGGPRVFIESLIMFALVMGWIIVWILDHCLDLKCLLVQGALSAIF